MAASVPMLNSDRIKVFLGVGISVVLIGWMYFAVDWATVLDAFSKVNYWILLPATAVIVVHFILRSWRWHYLLPDSSDATTRQLFDSINVGNFATFVLPLRAGEFIRPLLLSRWTNLSFSTCFASVVTERFFDLSTVLICFGIIACFLDGIPDLAIQGALALTTIALIIFVVIVVGSFKPDLVLQVGNFFFKFFPEKFRGKLERLLQEFLEGAGVIKNAKQIFWIVFISALVWLSNFILLTLMAYMLPIDPSFLMGVTVAVILALAVAAPSAPGFIGVYQAGAIAAFALFGVSKEYAVTFAIISHIHMYVLFIGYGCYVLFKNELSLGDLKAPTKAA